MSSRDVVGAQNFVGPLANTAKTVSLCWKKSSLKGVGIVAGMHAAQ